MIATGAAFAISLLIADRILERHQSRWSVPIMPVAIGLYLPFGIGTTILLGAIIGLPFADEADNPTGKGLLIAAGMIAGEALTGVLSSALVACNS